MIYLITLYRCTVSPYTAKVDFTIHRGYPTTARYPETHMHSAVVLVFLLRIKTAAWQAEEIVDLRTEIDIAVWTPVRYTVIFPIQPGKRLSAGQPRQPYIIPVCRASTRGPWFRQQIPATIVIGHRPIIPDSVAGPVLPWGQLEFEV